jgi:hypothetical protein
LFIRHSPLRVDRTSQSLGSTKCLPDCQVQSPEGIIY